MAQAHSQLTQHAANYHPTQADTQQVVQGQALFITGLALAMAEFACREMGYLEIMWYWTARNASPLVIDRLELPSRQFVTSASCEIPGGEILKLNRKVRRSGGRICAAGHSHGNFATFTSGTDHDNILRLATEGVGYRDPQAEATGPAALAVLFSTHNARGEHWFPVHVRRPCDTCHCVATTVNELPEVHVIGDVEIGEAAKTELRQQLADSVVNRSTYAQPVSAPARFQVWRYNRLVGAVPAAALEEAAHQVPALAKALGWGCQSSNANNVTNVVGNSKTCGRDGHSEPN